MSAVAAAYIKAPIGEINIAFPEDILDPGGLRLHSASGLHEGGFGGEGTTFTFLSRSTFEFAVNQGVVHSVSKTIVKFMLPR